MLNLRRRSGEKAVTERIKLTINLHEYPEGWDLSSAMWECWILGKLRDAGVPVKGMLKFNGIESGTLIRFDQPEDFGVTTFVWES